MIYFLLFNLKQKKINLTFLFNNLFFLSQSHVSIMIFSSFKNNISYKKILMRFVSHINPLNKK